MWGDTRLFDVLRYLLCSAGLLIFVVSLTFQGLVFVDLFSSWALGLMLAVGCEVGKVAVILTGSVTAVTNRFKRITRFATVSGMRLLFIIASLACTVSYLGKHIDRPRMDELKEADRVVVERLHGEELQNALSQAERQRDGDIEDLSAIYAVQRDRLRRDHEPQISRLEQGLMEEMDNVINGVFIGPRYREMERRLDNHRQSYQQALAMLETQSGVQITKRREQGVSAIGEARQRYQRTLNDALRVIDNNDYTSDDRVSLPIVRSARRLVAQTTGLKISDLQVGLFFAVLLSIMIEVAILCIFSQLADIVHRVVTAQSRIWQSRQIAIEDVVADLDMSERQSERHESQIDNARTSIERRARRKLFTAINTSF